MTNKLYISNLSHGVTKEQLEVHFAKIGKVISVKVMIDKEGLGRGFGFVEMETVEEAEKAKEMLNHTELDGKQIAIEEAKHHG